MLFDETFKIVKSATLLYESIRNIHQNKEVVNILRNMNQFLNPCNANGMQFVFALVVETTTFLRS